MGRQGQKADVLELDQLLGLTEEMAAYVAVSDEIDAASRTLEEHRAEFEALVQDGMEIVEHTRRLFAEKQFAKWRFTAEDVYRAFEAVGYPPGGRIEADENAEITEAALSYLADEDRRAHLARQLLMLLPKYVKAGRYIDAWLLQYSAYQMVEEPKRSNPFLFMMFYYGYEEWAAQIEDQEQEIAREMGIDLEELRTSSGDVDEYLARVEDTLSDPEKRAHLEKLYEQHDMLAAQMEEETQEWERKIMLLLEREDATRLYLSAEEMDPWIPVLVDRLAPMDAQMQQALNEGRREDPRISKALNVELTELAREMAGAIFTSERLAQLKEELRAYQRDLEAAQEYEAAMSAQAAMLLLGRHPHPEDEPFLIVICFISITTLVTETAEATHAGE
jgi:hypothetical protein